MTQVVEEVLAMLADLADADPAHLVAAVGAGAPLRDAVDGLLHLLPALRLAVAAVGAALRERPDLLPEAAALFTPELAEVLRAAHAAYLLTPEPST